MPPSLPPLVDHVRTSNAAVGWCAWAQVMDSKLDKLLRVSCTSGLSITNKNRVFWDPAELMQPQTDAAASGPPAPAAALSSNNNNHSDADQVPPVGGNLQLGRSSSALRRASHHQAAWLAQMVADASDADGSHGRTHTTLNRSSVRCTAASRVAGLSGGGRGGAAHAGRHVRARELRVGGAGMVVWVWAGVAKGDARSLQQASPGAIDRRSTGRAWKAPCLRRSWKVCST